MIVLKRKILFGYNFFLVIAESPLLSQDIAASKKFSLIEVSWESVEHSRNAERLIGTIHRIQRPSGEDFVGPLEQCK